MFCPDTDLALGGSSPSVPFRSVQFKMVFMRSEKPICAPPRLSEVSPALPLKRVHHQARPATGKLSKRRETARLAGWDKRGRNEDVHGAPVGSVWRRPASCSSEASPSSCCCCSRSGERRVGAWQVRGSVSESQHGGRQGAANKSRIALPLGVMFYSSTPHFPCTSFSHPPPFPSPLPWLPFSLAPPPPRPPAPPAPPPPPPVSNSFRALEQKEGYNKNTPQKRREKKTSNP